MRKSEKTLLLRFDLSRKTDREIWEWLHEKSESQTLSMNAFLIEGLRKLMAQEANKKPLDVRPGRGTLSGDAYPAAICAS